MRREEAPGRQDGPGWGRGRGEDRNWHPGIQEEAPSRGLPGRRVLASGVCRAEPAPGCAPARCFPATATAARKVPNPAAEVMSLSPWRRRVGTRPLQARGGVWAPHAPPPVGPRGNAAHSPGRRRGGAWGSAAGVMAGVIACEGTGRGLTERRLFSLRAASGALTTHPPTSPHSSP